MKLVKTQKGKLLATSVLIVAVVISLVVGLNAYYTQPLVVAPSGSGTYACQGSCNDNFYTASGGTITGSWTTTFSTTAALYMINYSSGGPPPPGSVPLWRGLQNTTHDSISHNLAPGIYALVWFVQGSQVVTAVHITVALTIQPGAWWWLGDSQ